MKTVIVLALLVVALPSSMALANGRASPSHAVASTGSSHQIPAPDVLVKNVLLPEWRANFFAREVKTWFKQGSAVLEGMTVIEDEIEETFSALTSPEKERLQIVWGS
ncbi:MAG TPA: hypothetical protein VM425_01875 [Myxococcota bacterium]|nr:hypothetical protein [Myxococcota bacterium]